MKINSLLLGLSLFLIHSSAYSICTEVNYTNGSKTVQTKAKTCDDGTVSFTQGKDVQKSGTTKDKKSGWEGLCGPTAAANVFNAYCQNLFVEPKSISTKYFSD